MISINDEKDNLILSFLNSNSKSNYIDYIRPIKNDEIYNELWIPSEILNFYVVYFLSKHNLLSNRELLQPIFEEFEECKPLLLKLKYSDIGGNIYIKNVKINISFSAYRTHELVDFPIKYYVFFNHNNSN